MNEYFIDPTTCPDADANTARDLPLAPHKAAARQSISPAQLVGPSDSFGIEFEFRFGSGALDAPFGPPARMCCLPLNLSHSLSLSLSLSVYFNLSVAQSVSV